MKDNVVSIKTLVSRKNAFEKAAQTVQEQIEKEEEAAIANGELSLTRLIASGRVKRWACHGGNVDMKTNCGLSMVHKTYLLACYCADRGQARYKKRQEAGLKIRNYDYGWTSPKEIAKLGKDCGMFPFKTDIQILQGVRQALQALKGRGDVIYKSKQNWHKGCKTEISRGKQENACWGANDGEWTTWDELCEMAGMEKNSNHTEYFYPLFGLDPINEPETVFPWDDEFSTEHDIVKSLEKAVEEAVEKATGCMTDKYISDEDVLNNLQWPEGMEENSDAVNNICIEIIERETKSANSGLREYYRDLRKAA